MHTANCLLPIPSQLPTTKTAHALVLVHQCSKYELSAAGRRQLSPCSLVAFPRATFERAAREHLQYFQSRDMFRATNMPGIEQVYSTRTRVGLVGRERLYKNKLNQAFLFGHTRRQGDAILLSVHHGE